jgi:hypothetical protein
MFIVIGSAAVNVISMNSPAAELRGMTALQCSIPSESTMHSEDESRNLLSDRSLHSSDALVGRDGTPRSPSSRGNLFNYRIDSIVPYFIMP